MTRIASTTDSSNAFIRRFDAFAVKYRRRRVLQTVCWALAAALAAFSLLVAADYLFELTYGLRVSASTLYFIAAAMSIATGAAVAVRRANDRAIAADLEHRFPELGQAVRTAVQFRKGASHAGASPALLAAMQNDLEARAAVLPLDQALARSRVRRAAMGVGVLTAVMLAALLGSWQWRLAAKRALFSNAPFTQVTVAPGDAEVDEGTTLRIVATVEGRSYPAVLTTRPAGIADAPWLSRELSPADGAEGVEQKLEYEVDLPKLDQSIEYRVVAGRYSTPAHRIDVRRLLDIEAIQIEVEPPAYTGAPPARFEEGSFRGLIGSHARLQFTLDRAVKDAALELTPLGPKSDDGAAPEPQSIPLRVDGATLSGNVELTTDAIYRVTGRGVDGTRIRDNRYRIRVLRDQLPRIAFREPAVESETHALAEIPMVATVSDDYGVTRAGIVFCVNNGREYSLVTFPRAEGDDKSSPTAPSHAMLEGVLPLEELDVSQRDSVAYYAFAEDNAPDGVRRIETEVRFLDIRPFRRTFRLPSGNGGGGGGGGRPQLASLEQLIRRERWLLNRSLRLARNVERGERTNVDDVDDAIRMQDDTAALTRELADAAAEVEAQLAITEDKISDLLYAAEEAMMRAVDALSVSQFSTSHLQQVDAAASLVAARNAVEILIAQGGGGSGLARLFQRDAELIRRMRGRRGNVQRMEEAARRLRSLANRERDVAGELIDLAMLEPEPVDDPDAGDAEMRASRLQELEKEQSGIADEAEDIDKLIEEIETITDLIRSRSSSGIENAATVSRALDRKAMDDAAAAARRASRQFRELAQHIEGIMPPEPAGRLAVARDVASFVAIELRRLGGDLGPPASSPPGTPSDPPKTADKTAFVGGGPPAETAEALAESIATVGDVLESIVTTYSEQQADVVSRLRQVLDENNLQRSASLLEKIDATMLAEQQQDAGLEVEAAADMMDQLAQRLDALHASIVAPRLAQVQALLQRATELQSQLSQLPSEAHARRWRQRLSGFVNDLESAEVKVSTTPELKAFASATPSAAVDGVETWPLGADGLLQPPKTHVATLDETVREIERYLHELAFGRIDAENANLAPPEYVDFVRRYLELLSEGAGR